tara:strand:+ start:1807 stop:2694 length:888 start_codon:yes stop_codon:yes gene_type:complete
LNNKTILVLGATGSIGRDLVTLLSRKYKIVALSRNKNFLKKIRSNKIKTIHHNLKDRIKQNIKADILINCIVTHPISKKKNLSDYIDSNIISPCNMIDFARKKGAKLIINLSSMTVYGKPKAKVINENAPFTYPDFLGITKIFAEQVLEMQKIKFINLRLPGVLCSNFDKQRPWLNEIIYKIKKNKAINLYNPNSNFNNLISSFEIYRLICHLIDRNTYQKGNYNFSATKPIKLIHLIEKIKEFYKSKSTIKKIKVSKNSFQISTKKIEKKINFRAESTLSILQKYLKLIEIKAY